MGSYSLQIGADIRAYQAEFAKIPGFTEKVAAQAAERMVRAQQAAATKIGTLTRRTMQDAAGAGSQGAEATRSNLINVGNQLADVAIQLEQGAPIGRIALQQGSQLASAAAMMGASLTTVLNPAVLATVAVVGALGTAWYLADQDARRFTESLERSGAEIGRARVAYEETTERLEDLSRKYKVSTGALSPVAAEVETALDKVRDSYAKSLDAQRENVAVLQLQAEAARQERDAVLRGSSGWRARDAQLQKALATQFQAQGVLEDTEAALERELQLTEAIIASETKKARAKEAAREAAQRAAEAERRAAEEARAASEALAAGIAEITEGYARSSGAADRLAAMRESALSRELSAIERVRAEEARLLAEAEEQREIGIVGAQNHAARRLEVEQEYAAAVVAIQDSANRQIDAARDDLAAKDARRAQEAADRQRELVRSTAGYVAQGIGAVEGYLRESYDRRLDYATRIEDQLLRSEEYLTDAQREELQARVDAAKAAARRQFRAQQAAAAVQAAINTALAVSEALASAPPPYNLIPAAVALAAGAAQQAAIATQAPPFHRGGMKGRGLGDEVMHPVLPGEAVVSRQGVATRERSVRDLNAGKRSGTGDGQVLLVYDRRIIGQAAADDIRAGGRLYESLATRGVPYGHTR